MTSGAKIKDYVEVAAEAAIEAGKAINSIYDDPDSDFGVEMKSDNSPLTVADRRAHAVIVSFLEKTGLPVLSEEGAMTPYGERKDWKLMWIVDPLDGTKEFIKRNGEFTVNIALVENSVPVAGVIYVPVKKILYWGVCGEGAFRCNGCEDVQPLDVLGHKAVRLPVRGAERPFTVVASRSHLSSETAEYIEKLKAVHPGLVTVSSGSSLKICAVAEGSADIYPRFAPTMEWDTAAGHAIARAAGFEMTDAVTGLPLCYNKEDLHNPWFIVSDKTGLQI